MVKSVFIDTNIYLEVYAINPLPENHTLKLFEKKIDEGEVKLFLPKQVIDEVLRNKQDKIVVSKVKSLTKWSKETLKRLPKGVIDPEKFNEINDNMEKVIEEYKTKAYNEELEGDLLLKSIQDKSQIIPTNKDILNKAKERCFLKGNPPRKEKEEKLSCGDAINWESLLITSETGEDIIIIAKDGDYSSELLDGKISNFLSAEWKEKKGGEVKLYTSISSF